MLAKLLRNGKIKVGVYTPTLALNTESVVMLITTCCSKKANKKQSNANHYAPQGIRLLREIYDKADLRLFE